MTKKIVLSAFVALFAAAVTHAQTDAQPRKGAGTPTPKKIERVDNKPKTAKDAGKIEHAEEKSNGAAYSGQGKGSDKDRMHKIENGKGHAKGHGKSNGKGKSKSKTKQYEGPDGKPATRDQGVEEVPQQGDNNPDEAAQRKETVNKKKEPKPATPQPAPTERKPGQRPAAGKEKENDH